VRRLGAGAGVPERPPGVKCDPDLAAVLRSRYAAITVGYHLNQRHWNTITLDGSVPEDGASAVGDGTWPK
jgi:predicted DNA-binding protein (MmcQ/YjbR family)